VTRIVAMANPVTEKPGVVAVSEIQNQKSALPN
jgi:hypothetical protein